MPLSCTKLLAALKEPTLTVAMVIRIVEIDRRSSRG